MHLDQYKFVFAGVRQTMFLFRKQESGHAILPGSVEDVSTGAAKIIALRQDRAQHAAKRRTAPPHTPEIPP